MGPSPSLAHSVLGVAAAVAVVAVGTAREAHAQDAVIDPIATTEVTDPPEVVTTTDAGPTDPCAGMLCPDPDPTDCLDYTCMNGACTPVPRVGACTPLDPCATGGACALDGSCAPTGYRDCNDGDACTFDGCMVGVCQHVAMPCDDGVACTTDTCVGGQCTFTPTPACGGVCPAGCDDHDPCTNDYCANGVCWHAPVSCEDGDPCTTDSCTPSGCSHLARICNDQNPCTADACMGGACVAFPIDGGACEDGDLCTRGDHCAGGACVGGAAKVCDDGTACTADHCDPATGQCSYPRAAGACESCGPGAGGAESYSASVDVTVPLGIDCPLVGGRAGVVLKAHGALQAEREGCPVCTASASGEVGLSAEITLCQGAKFEVSGAGKFASTRKYGTRCREDTCLLECGKGYCESEHFTGFAGLGVSRFFGFQRRWNAGGAAFAGGAAPALGVRCGVVASGQVTAAARSDASVDGGLGDGSCADCAAEGGDFVIGAAGSGGCAIDLSVGRWATSIACPGCAEFALEARAAALDGVCGAASSEPTELTSSASVTTPCMTVGLGWFAVAARCDTQLAASCDEAGCDLDGAAARCTVLGGLCE